MGQDFDHWIVLGREQKYIPVSRIPELVFRAFELASESRDAEVAGREALAFGFKYAKDDELGHAIREYRKAGRIRVFELGGLGVVRDLDVTRGVLLAEDFALFVAEEFNTGVVFDDSLAPGKTVALPNVERIHSEDVDVVAAEANGTGTSGGTTRPAVALDAVDLVAVAVEASAPHPPVPPNMDEVHAKRSSEKQGIQRSDPLRDEIVDVVRRLREAGLPETAPLVRERLKSRIQPTGPIYGITSDSFKWFDRQGRQQETTFKDVARRLKNVLMNM